MSYAYLRDYSTIYSSGTGGVSQSLAAFGLQPPNATGSASVRPQQPLGPDHFSEYENYDFYGWDGCDASPIDATTIAISRTLNNLLPRSAIADIAPGARGVIGFEWRDRLPGTNFYLLVEVGPRSAINSHYVDHEGNSIERNFNTIQDASAFINKILATNVAL